MLEVLKDVGSTVPDVSYEIIIFAVPMIVAVVACLGYVRYLSRGVAVDNHR